MVCGGGAGRSCAWCSLYNTPITHTQWTVEQQWEFYSALTLIIDIQGRPTVCRRASQNTRKPGDDEGDLRSRDAGNGDDSAGPDGDDVDGGGDVLTPGPAAGQSRSTSMFLAARLDAAMAATFGFTRCTHVDEDGMPMIRRTHTQKMWVR